MFGFVGYFLFNKLEELPIELKDLLVEFLQLLL